ncbi:MULTISPECIES: hypothetical protein [unclassified Arthrobacter]|uniref:hypothetical protein n=1 Tax=unclassified Arthrobacter TaxID=235627 RepID=UPI001D15A4ED|nr:MULTISPECIES: hypothetical protein [unclassified Arthrobacter]MCC3275813.1 hypothetical protein [Arthrobacter sp. zg-Y20]MCC9177136.1 hypothetical protein [Arthrobacter sp. zg-Y750]MDK1315970.1 hypothetical protein [Arthrobacter sp. zg.Y20]WIB06253.1 hypothetical protein QNO06_00415 [Arthrobacter sp. zg-Y20]
MTDPKAGDPKNESANPIENAVENLMSTSAEVPDGSGSQDHSDPRTEVHSNLAQGLNSDNENFKAKHNDK